MDKDKLRQEAHHARKEAHDAKEEIKSNLKREKKTKVILSLLKLTVLIIIIVAIPLYIYFFQKDMLSGLRSFDDVILLLEKYKTQSILVYIGVQVLQIVISVIPGQAFQFAAGYLYGFPLGLVFSIIGAFLGTVISFYLAKTLGKDAVHLLFGEDRMKYFIDRLNSRKAYTIVFLIYLIPGLPKDVMSYAAGISEMNAKAFLIISLVGRLPGMAGSLLIGSLYYTEHYTSMIIIAIAAVIAFCLCVMFRKKLSKYIDKFYEKIV